MVMSGLLTEHLPRVAVTVEAAADVKLYECEGFCEAAHCSRPGAGGFAPTNAVSALGAL